MKNLLILFALVFTFSMNAQENKPLLEKDGDLVKATYYHDNGQIAQIGFYKNSKPHGEWIAYDTTGKKIAIGAYDQGVKTGKWFFWQGEQLSEVDYNDSRIVNVTKWNNSNSVVVNQE